MIFSEGITCKEREIPVRLVKTNEKLHEVRWKMFGVPVIPVLILVSFLPPKAHTKKEPKSFENNFFSEKEISDYSHQSLYVRSPENKQKRGQNEFFFPLQLEFWKQMSF